MVKSWFFANLLLILVVFLLLVWLYSFTPAAGLARCSSCESGNFRFAFDTFWALPFLICVAFYLTCHVPYVVASYCYQSFQLSRILKIAYMGSVEIIFLKIIMAGKEVVVGLCTSTVLYKLLRDKHIYILH